jgi:hypothetical protein
MKKIYGSYKVDLVPKIDRLLAETELRYPGKKFQVNIHMDENMVIHAVLEQRRDMRIYVQVRKPHSEEPEMTFKEVVDENHALGMLRNLLHEIEQRDDRILLSFGLEEKIEADWLEWRDDQGLSIRSYL